MMMPELRGLRQDIHPSKTEAGDAISAIIIAISMIASHCKKLQYQRKIVLVTNGRGKMDDDDLSAITGKVREDNIQLTVLGVDFDDPDYGYKEEDKDLVKASNEAMLKTLTEECNGSFGTVAQAIGELGVPRMKEVRPVHSFKGFLTLGNAEEYSTAMHIPVERYPRTMVQRPPAASNFVIRSDLAPGESTQSTATLIGDDGAGIGDLAAVKNARTYQVVDEDAPGGKRDVERDELAKGYEYGRTAVHISESDQNVTTYETSSGMDVIGFVTKEQFERFMEMSRTNVIIAQKTDDKASMALSSFIHALYETDSYAIARLVAKENKQPLIVLLVPSIESDFECLYDVELPFSEDIRSYRFLPLDRVITVAGKTLTQHRNLPSATLQRAMSDLVDHMDLSNYGQDDEGNPSEYMPIDDTFSPVLHRINQVIKHRAVHSDVEIPPPYEILTRYSKPPEELVSKAQPYLDKMLAVADVKKVPPKVRSRKYRRDVPKPLSGLDVAALLNTTERRQRISPQNAVPEFKQLLANADNLETIQDACTQLSAIIFDVIRHSVGDSGYARALEAIRVMREETVELEEPKAFNDFVKDLKSKILSGELGGERREMWWLVRVNKVGLIQKRECHPSDVSEEEAKAFMSAK
ncbi:ATP-dependent DNA helicase yku80 [Elasticomyces elasticus]|nr:ATP-dependent DNA helicase yku80 [Elasticomyces elasticus]